MKKPTYQEQVTFACHDLMIAFIGARTEYRADKLTKEEFNQKCTHLLSAAFDKYQELTFAQYDE